MQFRQLGDSGLEVSTVCLGSMTWGEQNSAAEAHQQLDYAIDQGVNFVDTAELYAIPPKAETCGKTESIIGSWLQKSGRRSRIILASKVCGPTAWCPHIRQGRSILDRENITRALEASLIRLKTDYLDLYQVHWPERNSNFFGKLGFAPEDDCAAVPIEETLAVLSDLVKTGKIRHIGISNETPWGMMRYLHAADTGGLTRIVSIQNPYSLLNRSFEVGLAEISCREQVGLLAYSPLGFGVLSGKYRGGKRPAGTRLSLFPDYKRYTTDAGVTATEAYVNLALEHGLDPAGMALAFVNSRPFITSTIIGATSLQQLKNNISGINTRLGKEVLAGIEAIHQQHSNPCP